MTWHLLTNRIIVVDCDATWSLWPDRLWLWAALTSWYILEGTSLVWRVESLSASDLAALIFLRPPTSEWWTIRSQQSWDKFASRNRLSFGRRWPRIATWNNFVSTSDGLWWAPTFSNETMQTTPSLRSWVHTCLNWTCFSFLTRKTLKPSSCLLMNLSWQGLTNFPVRRLKAICLEHSEFSKDGFLNTCRADLRFASACLHCNLPSFCINGGSRSSEGMR